MKISIIILSWNTRSLLRDCLNSLSLTLATNHKPLTTEIIVVDNGSEDGSREMLKKVVSDQWPVISEEKSPITNHQSPITIRLILNQTNLGFAKGNNQGIKIAQGEYIMLLNSDTIVKKRALEKLVKFLDENPQVGAVSPLLLNPDNTPQIDYYMKFPNLWQIFLYHNPVLRPMVMKTPLRWLVVSRGDKGNGKNGGFEVDQLPGAALMARKRAWDKVGLLDEDYQFLFEDVDWCWRAKKQGFSLMVIPDAKIIHIGGASWKKRLKENSLQFYRQFFSSMLLFVEKNYGSFRSQVFRMALVAHFLATFKPRLGFWFIVAPGRQKRLWQ